MMTKCIMTFVSVICAIVVIIINAHDIPKQWKQIKMSDKVRAWDIFGITITIFLVVLAFFTATCGIYYIIKLMGGF